MQQALVIKEMEGFNRKKKKDLMYLYSPKSQQSW